MCAYMIIVHNSQQLKQSKCPPISIWISNVLCQFSGILFSHKTELINVTYLNTLS